MTGYGSNQQLVDQATADYGDLIAKIVLWPEGLGIDAHLIGGIVVQYLPNGKKHYPVGNLEVRRLHRIIAVLRGRIRNLLH